MKVVFLSMLFLVEQEECSPVQHAGEQDSLQLPTVHGGGLHQTLPSCAPLLVIGTLAYLRAIHKRRVRFGFLIGSPHSR